MRSLVVVVTLQLGCGASPKGCPAGGCASGETRQYYDEPRAHPVDVVVVMDDSPSMAGKQARVLEALRAAFDEVFSYRLRDLDIELRVISSTVAGVSGCGAASVADCSLPQVLHSSATCGEAPNFAGPGGAALACAARFPATGCAVEQPLAALEASLERGPKLRSGSYVFVLIVTDEDDCSTAAPLAVDPSDGAESAQRCREADRAGTLTPVSDYVDFLTALTAPRSPVVSVVAPILTSCGGAGIAADPPLRLKRFADAFGGSALTDFCAEDWSSAVNALTSRLALSIEPPCLPDGVVDHDPAAPGVQPDCAVTEHPPNGPPRAIPPCPASDGVCWRAKEQVFCSTSGYSIVLDQRTCLAPAGTLLEIACATAP